ncbi:hypothetical protein [Streptomyces sp. NPDC059957]|uniref:hypothetical protein n=1 Tax=unclassified Streptomyces TaxID=2593676 RepID=UPI00364BB675
MLHEVEDIEAERYRVSHRPESDTAPPVLAHVELTVDGDPVRFADRLRGVLDAVLHIAATESFDGDEDLPVDTVPGWFAGVCRGGGPVEPFAARGRDRYAQRTGDTPWALQDWLWRFDPALEVRGWAWWDLTAPPAGDGVLRLWLDTWGEPSFAREELRWLLYTAGARAVRDPAVVRREVWAGEASVAGGTTGPVCDGASGPRALVERDGTFAPSWLRDKTVVPVPAGARIDAALSGRIAAGCRAVGASSVLASHLAEEPGSAGGTRSLPAGRTEGTDIHPPFLLRTPDLQGAVLFPGPGHALIAGTAAFMTAAVVEGHDAARARFGRHARALADRHPALPAVAAAHPPVHRAWSRTDEVDPASAAARRLALLDAFTDGACTAPDFAAGWREARSASLADGERVQGPLGALFDEVFMVLEDYAADPELAEPGDLDDAGLRAAVRAARDSFRHAQPRRSRK